MKNRSFPKYGYVVRLTKGMLWTVIILVCCSIGSLFLPNSGVFGLWILGGILTLLGIVTGILLSLLAIDKLYSLIHWVRYGTGSSRVTEFTCDLIESMLPPNSMLRR